METDVRKILQGLADTAVGAAEEARSAAQSAKKAVSDKYDSVRLNMEISRLHTQQERLFADIGRTLFLVQSGSVTAEEAAALFDGTQADCPTEPQGAKTPHQIIDSLLMNAAQLQHEIDNLSEKLATAKSQRACPTCARACNETDVFCAVCGAKL